MSVRGIGDATATHIIENRPYSNADAVLENNLLSAEVLGNLKRELLDEKEEAA